MAQTMPTPQGPRTAPDLPRLARGWELALIGIFLLVVAVPGLATLAGVDRETVRGENRALAPFPRVALDREALRALPDGLTRYFEDHFAFRARLVEWQSRVRLEYLGASPSSAVVAGKDGWLFYADDGSMEDYISARPFTDEELEVWRRTLQRTQDWLESRGITYLFVIVPDKHVIYPEMMPDTVRPLHDQSRIDSLVAHLAAHSTVRVLDLRPALVEAKRHERIYHRTDTHWNDRGAYVGYEQILRQLGTREPGLAPVQRAAFDVRAEQTGGRDLAGMLGLADSMTEEDLVLAPRVERCARIVEESVAGSRGSAARVVTECKTPGLPRAVIFRDSFASALVPFLSEHFSRALYLWQRDMDPAVILEERPDVVIQEWVGRRLSTALPYDWVATLETTPRPLSP